MIFIEQFFFSLHWKFHFSAAATGPTYPAAQQSGYAVAPTATYSAQRTGYDQATYQAATQGTYAGMNKKRIKLLRFNIFMTLFLRTLINSCKSCICVCIFWQNVKCTIKFISFSIQFSFIIPKKIIIILNRRRNTRCNLWLWLWSYIWYNQNLLSTSTIGCYLCSSSSTIRYNDPTSYKGIFRFWWFCCENLINIFLLI